MGTTQVIDLDNIQEFNYFEEDNKLVVTYQGGTVSTYHPVNPENFAEIIKSDCLIRAIRKVIRQPHIVGVN